MIVGIFYMTYMQMNCLRKCRLLDDCISAVTGNCDNQCCISALQKHVFFIHSGDNSVIIQYLIFFLLNKSKNIYFLMFEVKMKRYGAF